jgi:hypothetical protein
MRAIFAAAIPLLIVSWATPEPDYATLTSDSLRVGGAPSLTSVVDEASSEVIGERATITPPATDKTATQNPPAAVSQTPPAPATNSNPTSEPLPNPSKASTTSQVSLDGVCNALVTSAVGNDLPVAFFANLIWQESRLRDDAVSPKGALGIAQFMPKVAAESGLENPFDPLQALPASARLLGELRDQFGNLGFVAAAYNAGAKRVNEWLDRGRTLPRETRDYVLDVTGHSVEQWQKAPPNDDALQFARRLPCRDFPLFAELEQAQLQQAKLDHQEAQQAQAQQQPKPKVEATAPPPKQERVAETKHTHPPQQHEQERVAETKHMRIPSRLAEARVAEIIRHTPRLEEVRFTEHERLRGRHEARDRIRRGPQEERRRA